MTGPAGDGIAARGESDMPTYLVTATVQVSIDADNKNEANNLNTLSEAARTLRAARSRLDKAMDTAREAATDAYSHGRPEAQIARELGVNRMTVRRWLGKSQDYR